MKSDQQVVVRPLTELEIERFEQVERDEGVLSFAYSRSKVAFSESMGRWVFASAVGKEGSAPQ
ncbi:hypothetical protein [Vibrio barjaei]|uniref:hypothetical protein n=1 Tax=Vibrio barjaei TaxID=1676683 RepID=UPI002283DC54|nr:hypothetical protein [Vibrio barjaei]MCY9874511.1 hypothetical protein [Vibrio barjaei]